MRNVIMTHTKEVFFQKKIKSNETMTMMLHTHWSKVLLEKKQAVNHMHRERRNA